MSEDNNMRELDPNEYFDSMDRTKKTTNAINLVICELIDSGVIDDEPIILVNSLCTILRSFVEYIAEDLGEVDKEFFLKQIAKAFTNVRGSGY